MSVFYLVSADSEDRIPSFFHQKAEALRERGCTVSFGVLDSRTSPNGLLRNYRRLRREVEQAQPALVHAKYGSMTAAMGYWIKGARPFVVSFIGDDLLGTPLPGFVWRVRERIARRIGLWAAQRADSIFVRSKNLLEALPSGLRARAQVLPDGVDVDWYRPLDKDACRDRLGWPREARVILFNGSSGTNTYVKNPQLAKAAVDLLATKVPGVSLHMMSGASSEEVLWMLNAADCLLVTSFHEGAPKIVQEALACNLPVVSVPCGDVAERLEGIAPGGICGYDALQLAEHMHLVLETGSRSNGREQLLAQGVTTDGYADRALQLYRSLLA